MEEMVLPGTYISVREEALISAGRVVSGNIGVVGTAAEGPVNEVRILGSFTEAKELYKAKETNEGEDTSAGEDNTTLLCALEQIYNNGGRTVYAVRTPGDEAAEGRDDNY